MSTYYPAAVLFDIKLYYFQRMTSFSRWDTIILQTCHTLWYIISMYRYEYIDAHVRDKVSFGKQRNVFALA